MRGMDDESLMTFLQCMTENKSTFGKKMIKTFTKIIDEKMNVNTNRNPSVQSLQSNQSDVDDISAEFEYFEALMSAFVESVSSTGSERRK